MKIHVLIVDDEKVVCEGMVNRLAHINHEAVGAVDYRQDAREALALLRAEPSVPRLVFVDINMPAMDGIAFIREAQGITDCARYVVLTAYDDFSYARESLRLGVDDYLLKPVLLEQFKKSLAESAGKLLAQAADSRKEEALASALDKLAYGNADGLTDALLSDEHMGGWMHYRIGMTAAAILLARQSEHYAVLPFRQGTAFLLGHDKKADAREVVNGFVQGFGGVSTDGTAQDCAALYAEAEEMLCVARFFPALGFVMADARRNVPSAGLAEADRRALVKLLRAFEKERYQKMIVNLFPDTPARVPHMEDVAKCYSGVLRAIGSVAYAINLEIELPVESIAAFRNVNELREALYAAFDALAGALAKKLGRFTLEDSLRYIHDNLDSVNLTTIANYSDLSYAYFSQLFKRIAGKSFMRYTSDLKMKAAMELLQQGKRVAEVTADLGYTSPKNFTRAFKNHYGVSPAHIRKLGKDKAHAGEDEWNG